MKHKVRIAKHCKHPGCGKLLDYDKNKSGLCGYHWKIAYFKRNRKELNRKARERNGKQHNL